MAFVSSLNDLWDDSTPISFDSCAHVAFFDRRNDECTGKQRRYYCDNEYNLKLDASRSQRRKRMSYEKASKWPVTRLSLSIKATQKVLD